MKNLDKLAIAIIETAIEDYKAIPVCRKTKRLRVDLIAFEDIDAIAFRHRKKPLKYTLRKLKIAGIYDLGISRLEIRRRIFRARKLKQEPKMKFQMKATDAQSAVTFFSSNWYSELCDGLGTDGSMIREKLSASALGSRKAT